MKECPIYFVLRDNSFPKYLNVEESAKNGEPRYCPGVLTYSFNKCIEAGWIPIYQDKESTSEISVSGMFTKEGNSLATQLTKDVCAAIESGVKRDIVLLYLKNRINYIGWSHSPEIYDSAVREGIAYYLDGFLTNKGLEKTSIDEF